MKKGLVLILVAVGFLSGCSEYSEGDKVIALPEYSDLRVGFIESTVVSSSDNNVVIRADNIRGDRYIPGYAVGEMKTVPTSILMGLEKGLAVGTARAEFFKDSQLSRTINRAARFQSVNFSSLPLKDWIAKADKADLDEWSAAFKAIRSMKRTVESHKAEMESLNIKDLAASKAVLLPMLGDIKKNGMVSIAEFTSILSEKDYVKNGAPMLTNTPVRLLKSFFEYVSSIRKDVSWDMSQAEAWNEINLAILGTEEALNIALQKGLNEKPSIIEGAYKKVAQEAYHKHLKQEALDLLIKRISENKNASDEELNAVLSSHFTAINEVDKEFALQAGKDLLKGYRDTQNAAIAKQKAAAAAIADAKALKAKKAALAKKIHKELKSAKYWKADSNELGVHYPWKLVFGKLEGDTIQLNTYVYGNLRTSVATIDGDQISFKLGSTAFYSGTYKLGSKKLVLTGYQSTLTATPVYN